MSIEKNKTQRSLKDCAGITGVGIAMGAADVVPGVSGGTMAFILGIYEELLDTIKSFNLEFVRLLLSFKIKAAFEHINGKFLASLGLGLAISILSLAQLVTWLYEHHQSNLFAFFFGLILASIAIIATHVRWNLKTVASLVAGTVIAYLIVRLVPVNMPKDPFTIFWCGAVAIMAMILPGISGSFIMLILGQYHYIMTAVKELHVISLLPFAAGCATGLIGFSHILSWLLARYHQIMVSFLTGFMVGSLWKIWPFRKALEFMETSHGEKVPVREEIFWPGFDASILWLPALLCLVGFVIVYGMDRMQKKVAPGHTIGG